MRTAERLAKTYYGRPDALICRIRRDLKEQRVMLGSGENDLKTALFNALLIIQELADVLNSLYPTEMGPVQYEHEPNSAGKD